ncbi:MAG: hypothetical protein N2606_05485 [Candidatus Omnitrophica bacterium]|nr:hypothetical protein [Candidatus Omnitrophota bacterium]
MYSEYLFDRQDYLQLLEKRVEALKDGYRQNIAILGNENIGKTTIIHTFLSKFLDSRYVMVYLELRSESQEEFVRRFIAVFLYNFLTNSSEMLKEDLAFLIEKAKVYIPLTVSKIESLLQDIQRRKQDRIISRLFSLPSTLHQETGKFCVVLLDEFHLLETVGFKKLYTEWTQQLMSDRKTMYIIISSAITKAERILNNQLSLLFGNFEVVRIEPFDIQTSARFIDERCIQRPLRNEERNFLIHFTGGWPFYLGMIADAYCANKKLDLVTVLEQLLFNSSGILFQRFLQNISRFQQMRKGAEFLKVVSLVAVGHNRIKDISHIIKKPIQKLNSTINFLLEEDILSRCGDFLKVADRVFGFWLRFVYQEKLSSLTFDAITQKVNFRKCLEQMITEFNQESTLSINERMAQLLQLFMDERIQIERTKVTLNHFWEIKPIEFNSKHLREGLICRSPESTWIIGFGSDILTDEDIQEFSQLCKRFRSKLVRKIIITAKGLDPNSRLKALDENIWTWGIEHLNEMCDLFSKPRIIQTTE